MDGGNDLSVLQSAVLSEVFHDLSQPLTALECNLELSLRCDKTVADFVERIQTALETVGHLRQRMLLVHALNHAADSGGITDTADLNEIILELHGDLLPVFEAEQRSLALETIPAAAMVRVPRSKLTQALFYFLEYLFRYAPEESTTNLQVGITEQGTAALRIVSESCLPLTPFGDNCAEPYACEVELARRTFHAVGGDFEFVSGDTCHNVWLATLPLA
jgi:K+-sensing histidine kinase KdpD